MPRFAARQLGLFGLALLFGLVLAGVQPPNTAGAKIFEPTTFTLDNGLQVVVIINRRAPIVSHMVWYRVGAADDPVGKSGIAHFLEHLMFKGTDSLKPGEFSRIVAANGGQENAFTSQDFTAYHQTVAADRLDIMMRHEADRMVNLRLSDDVVLPERDVILEERRSRTDNEPSAQLQEMARAALYLHHPYGTPVIGWEHEIQGLTSEDAIDFYRRWYAPNNAVLIVAGDVEVEQVRRLAETHYGPIPAGAIPDRVRVSEPRQTAARGATLTSPQVRQPSVSMSYLAPSYTYGSGTADAGEGREPAYALQVLDEILGGGTTSRFYRSLVVEQGIAAGAGTDYSASSLDLSTFSLYGSPRPGTEIETIEAALRKELELLLREGVSDDEVAAAKQRLSAAAIYARDSLSTGAQIFGRSLTTGSSVEDVESWPERIGAVTADQVNAAARAVFRDARSVTSTLLPEPTS